MPTKTENRMDIHKVEFSRLESRYNIIVIWVFKSKPTWDYWTAWYDTDSSSFKKYSDKEGVSLLTQQGNACIGRIVSEATTEIQHTFIKEPKGQP